jgi:hypothetical protein
LHRELAFCLVDDILPALLPLYVVVLHYQVALPFLDKISNLHLCLLLTGHHLALHGRWVHVAEIVSGRCGQIILGRLLVRELARSLRFGPMISGTSWVGMGRAGVGRKRGSIPSS